MKHSLRIGIIFFLAIGFLEVNQMSAKPASPSSPVSKNSQEFNDKASKLAAYLTHPDVKKGIALFSKEEINWIENNKNNVQNLNSIYLLAKKLIQTNNANEAIKALEDQKNFIALHPLSRLTDNHTEDEEKTRQFIRILDKIKEEIITIQEKEKNFQDEIKGQKKDTLEEKALINQEDTEAEMAEDAKMAKEAREEAERIKNTK